MLPNSNSTTSTLINEQVNSVPFLLGLIENLGVGSLIDAHVRPHGHWQGASVGTLVTIWLAHILSERSHHLIAVLAFVVLVQSTGSRLCSVGVGTSEVGVGRKSRCKVDWSGQGSVGRPSTWRNSCERPCAHSAIASTDRQLHRVAATLRHNKLGSQYTRP